MRRMLKWIGIFVMMCTVLFSGCADHKEEKEGLLEVEDLSGETISEEETAKENGTSEADDRKSQPQSIYVYVCGQVKTSGVYELEEGSRLYEAVEAAGGMTEAAADTYLNQAQRLEDGQQIYVPSKEETENGRSSGSLQNQENQADGRVNLNTASKEELMTLNGIGEARADAIIRFREEHGSFQSTEEIKKVEGIKDGVYNKIKEQIKI